MFSVSLIYAAHCLYAGVLMAMAILAGHDRGQVMIIGSAVFMVLSMIGIFTYRLTFGDI